jgi:enoyl-CoA hydratase
MFARNLTRAFCAAKSGERLILQETRGKVALLTLNRPKALNALNDELMKQINETLQKIDSDTTHNAIVLTGSQKAFAAGADIKEMKDTKYPWTFESRMLGTWTNVSHTRKPVIAAVNGYALGGGFELALMCDIIYAGAKAQFGLPEVTIGTIPGAGGTQRLVREIGKSRAMEMILTGNFIDAETALRYGLVSKVCEPEKLVDEALALADKIASHGRPSIAMAKDCVNKAYTLGLDQGLEYEKRVFWSTFATQDQKEGMGAFSEKRKPAFKHE